MISSKLKGPLDLPEIRNRLAEFLCVKDAVSCLRVSRSWYDSFAPCVWASISLSPSLLRASYPRYPSLPGIHRNARFVRSLALAYPRFGSEAYVGTWFGRLERLTFHVNQGTWAALGSLVRSSPRLLELKIDGQQEVLPSLDSGLSFWNAMKEAPLLQYLVIEDLGMDERSAGVLWDTCRQTGGGKGIRTLRLSAVHFKTIGTGLVDNSHIGSDNDNDNEEESATSALLPEAGLDSIVDFELETCRESNLSLNDQLKLLLRLPSVKKLRWSLPVARRSTFQSFEREWVAFQTSHQVAVSNATSKVPWSSVEELTLTGMAVSDECLASIIGCLHPLSRLSVNGSCFGASSLASLVRSRHCEVLRALSLRGCEEAKSPIIQEIMELCSPLEELTADTLSFEDVARGKPWACADLRRLDVFVNMGGSMWTENERHRLIFGRIGKLLRLEYLSVGRQSYGEVFANAMVLSLRTGLAALQGLDRLQFVSMEGIVSEMDREDVEWIANHWTRLNYIQSNICSCHAARTMLIEYLQSRQVHVQEWHPCSW